MTTPTTDPSRLNGAATTPPTAAELRAEIARTRADLATTTEALVERFDVPSRVKARVRRSDLLHDRGTLVAAAIAVVGTVVAIWAFRRRG
jgi:hypothetical protein